MNGLREKFRNKKGFTLIEMLIVVAIIAILIAVSIPLVNGALERSRDAADQANERAAKAITLLYFMGTTTDTIDGTGTYTAGSAINDTTKIYYDAKTGNLSFTLPKNYGQCTCQASCYNGAADGTHAGKVIQVTITAAGVFTPKWVAGSAT